MSRRYLIWALQSVSGIQQPLWICKSNFHFDFNSCALQICCTIFFPSSNKINWNLLCSCKTLKEHFLCKLKLASCDAPDSHVKPPDFNSHLESKRHKIVPWINARLDCVHWFTHACVEGHVHVRLQCVPRVKRNLVLTHIVRMSFSEVMPSSIQFNCPLGAVCSDTYPPSIFHFHFSLLCWLQRDTYSLIYMKI